ncbi:aldehyde dehydrogenase [Massilia sp. WF1]|uniref:aldehyde dehydrogenase family protein n=1 Tax=unclassified Massilia TaxID=2609279 RepID=UPI00064A2C9C|nr:MULTISPECIES: aldehyde dehydrogenase family protein [unclassified Massilia]ALK99984.1 aldehyde dehydrogenase [Massilia sp. WG5]KLU36882.1 aldehyde dehydrogenase [Massilia sp. WF1]
MSVEMKTESNKPGSARSELAEKYFQAEYGHFINGEWVGGTSGEKIAMINPANLEVLSYIQSGNAEDANRAVEAASRAFPKWSRSSPQERQSALYEMARRLRARAKDYAAMLSLDNGKPIMEAMHIDIPSTIGQFELFAGAAFGLQGHTIDAKQGVAIVHREPLGVIAQIIPWNVPLVMMATKIAPALAAGNTIVLKPAETVCLAVMEFIREMADLLPPGVLNVITGYGTNVGEALVTHPKVRKVAFTGSRPTAQKLMHYASVNVIPQTLELGGKSANIVCADADIGAAAESAAMSIVVNKGEICFAATRHFVHQSVMDPFLEKVQTILSKIRVGDPLNPSTQMGPQASRLQFDKVLGYLDIGRNEGATTAMGGKRATVSGFEQGYFIEPTVFTNVHNTMRIAQEEIFGPVGVVIPWNDEADVIREANDTEFGLAAGLWTRNITQAHRMAREIEAGTVWVNRYFNMIPNVPFGGYKQSGFGREFSLEVLNHYTQLKSVIVSLEEGPIGLFDH